MGPQTIATCTRSSSDNANVSRDISGPEGSWGSIREVCPNSLWTGDDIHTDHTTRALTLPIGRRGLCPTDYLRLLVMRLWQSPKSGLFPGARPSATSQLDLPDWCLLATRERHQQTHSHFREATLNGSANRRSTDQPQGA